LDVARQRCSIRLGRWLIRLDICSFQSAQQDSHTCRLRTVVKEVVVEDVVVLIVGVARRAAGHHSHCELLRSAIMRVVTGLKLRSAARCSMLECRHTERMDRFQFHASLGSASRSTGEVARVTC